MGVCLGSKTTTLQREINYTSDEIIINFNLIMMK